MARIPARRYLPRPKTRKGTGFKPKNERPYMACKVAMKKLLKNPNNAKWIKFKKAYNKLFFENKNMGLVFMKKVEQGISVDMMRGFKDIH